MINTKGRLQRRAPAAPLLPPRGRGPSRPSLGQSPQKGGEGALQALLAGGEASPRKDFSPRSESTQRSRRLFVRGIGSGAVVAFATTGLGAWQPGHVSQPFYSAVTQKAALASLPAGRNQRSSTTPELKRSKKTRPPN